MATVNEKMTAIANPIRTLMGTRGTMGLDAMASNLNTANTHVSAALAALVEKGVDTTGAGLAELAALIGGIEVGGGVRFSKGRFTPSTDIKNNHVVSHDLGVVPDIVAVYDTGRYITTKWGTFITIITADNYGDAYPTHTAQQYGTGQMTFYADGVAEGFGATTSTLANADENTITFNPNNIGYFFSGRTYSWFAISGVT